MTITARPGAWTLDTTSSSAEFAVRNLLVKTVRGSFPIRTATVSIGDAGRPRTLRAVLPAGGFATDSSVRDNHIKHIKSKRILDTAAYPDLMFDSTGIAAAGPDTWLIDGGLTVRDHTSPLELVATIRAFDPDRAEVTTTATLHRHAASISNVPAFVVGKDIAIELTAVLRPAP